MKILHSQTGLEHSTLVGHSAWVTYIDWAADGTKIVSACADGTVKYIYHKLLTQLKNMGRIPKCRNNNIEPYAQSISEFCCVFARYTM